MGPMLEAVGERSARREGPKTIASVERVGAALELFEANHPERGVGEAAALLGISKSAAHALFSTLVEIGLLERTSTARYRLGWRLLVLARELVRSIEYRDPVLPLMRSFAARYGETMHLGVLDRGRLVYVQKAEGAHATGIPTQTGVRLHAHSSAVGKTLLATLDHGTCAEVLEREAMPAFTPHTVTDPRRLADDLDRILLQGYAIDREETMRGFCCIAVPLRAATGSVVAAMSVCARTERFERDWPTYLRALRQASEAASERLCERAFARSEPPLSAIPPAAVMTREPTSRGDEAHAA